MLLERSKSETTLDVNSFRNGKVAFTKDFLKYYFEHLLKRHHREKPTSGPGLPRIRSRNSIVEASVASSLSPSVPKLERSKTNISASGLTVYKKFEPVEDEPAGRANSTKAKNLQAKQRLTVSFNCSPFDKGGVRVASNVANPKPTTGIPSYAVYSTPYGWVPPIVHAAPELPSRLDPTHPLPPAPQRQVTSWETIDGHWRNEQRANTMRRLQHVNSNEMLAKMYYGKREEIDSYKKHMRSILKDQMEEQWKKSRKSFHLDLSESDAAIEYDKECLREDRRADWQKRMYLRQFALDNYQLAHERKQRELEQRQKELENERRVLAYNPINWSGTMT